MWIFSCSFDIFDDYFHWSTLETKHEIMEKVLGIETVYRQTDIGVGSVDVQ